MQCCWHHQSQPVTRARKTHLKRLRVVIRHCIVNRRTSLWIVYSWIGPSLCRARVQICRRIGENCTQALSWISNSHVHIKMKINENIRTHTYIHAHTQACSFIRIPTSLSNTSLKLCQSENLPWVNAQRGRHGGTESPSEVRWPGHVSAWARETNLKIHEWNKYSHFFKHATHTPHSK